MRDVEGGQKAQMPRQDSRAGSKHVAAREIFAASAYVLARRWARRHGKSIAIDTRALLRDDASGARWQGSTREDAHGLAGLERSPGN